MYKSKVNSVETHSEKFDLKYKMLKIEIKPFVWYVIVSNMLPNTYTDVRADVQELKPLLLFPTRV